MITKDDLKDDFFLGNNGKIESPKQHWFYEFYKALPPNDRNIDGLIKEYDKIQEKEAITKTIVKDTKLPYKRPSRQILYNWLNNFEWKARIRDSLYNDIENITDEASEYTLFMYRENKEIHMDMVKLHKAIKNLVEYYTGLVQRQLKNPSPSLTREEHYATVAIQNKLSYQLQSFSNLQWSGTGKINKDIPTLQEWKEIKDRLMPHHNPNTSEEEALQSNIDTIDYFYDKYVNTE